MNIENQVCSLELAKKLKELGVKKDSIFYWADGILVNNIEMELLLENGTVRTLSGVYNDWPDRKVAELYSAFSVAELGEMLPHDLIVKYKDFFGDIDQVSYRLMIQKTDPNDWNVYYYEKHEENCDFSDSNLANALAKMLIHLIENKLIELPISVDIGSKSVD